MPPALTATPTVAPTATATVGEFETPTNTPSATATKTPTATPTAISASGTEVAHCQRTIDTKTRRFLRRSLRAYGHLVGVLLDCQLRFERGELSDADRVACRQKAVQQTKADRAVLAGAPGEFADQVNAACQVLPTGALFERPGGLAFGVRVGECASLGLPLAVPADLGPCLAALLRARIGTVTTNLMPRVCELLAGAGLGNEYGLPCPGGAGP